MSYYEALADNIRISKKNGFTIYYPPSLVRYKVKSVPGSAAMNLPLPA